MARLTSPPVSKEAPLAFCAIIILSTSSDKMGMNLKAILIMTAMSCTGTLIYFSGDIRLSIPSVMPVGVVVNVSSVVPMTSNTSLSTILTEKMIPSKDTLKRHQLQ